MYCKIFKVCNTTLPRRGNITVTAGRRPAAKTKSHQFVWRFFCGSLAKKMTKHLLRGIQNALTYLPWILTTMTKLITRTTQNLSDDNCN